MICKLPTIEVMELIAASGMILLMPNSRLIAEDRCDCHWFYVVNGCANAPRLEETIRDPARRDWQEVTKVEHYYLSVDAMSRPIQVRTDSLPYGGKE